MNVTVLLVCKNCGAHFDEDHTESMYEVDPMKAANKALTRVRSGYLANHVCLANEDHVILGSAEIIGVKVALEQIR